MANAEASDTSVFTSASSEFRGAEFVVGGQSTLSDVGQRHPLEPIPSYEDQHYNDDDNHGNEENCRDAACHGDTFIEEEGRKYLSRFSALRRHTIGCNGQQEPDGSSNNVEKSSESLLQMLGEDEEELHEHHTEMADHGPFEKNIIHDTYLRSGILYA